ncbi:unnamed protein product [Didymodactylos carnosus]|nr:unnamed protein product [Didymodactylos carnosus]CAF4540193.1 unnamed protein product [Didymodactylos carnosus]
MAFNAHCRISSAWSTLYLRIRVDNLLILGNQLSTDMTYAHTGDGGVMVSNGQTPGTHVIDVVAMANGGGYVKDGFLRVKLTQFDHGADINMSPV